MSLIRVSPHDLIGTESGLHIHFDPGVPKVTVHRGDATPVVFRAPGNDAQAVWASFCRWAAPAPDPALRGAMDVLHGLSVAVERLGARVESIARRLADVEAEVFEGAASGTAPVGLGVTPEVAARLIAVRDALIVEDYPEAWHQLYAVADPTFTTTYSRVDDLSDRGPWKALEAIAAGKVDGAEPASPEPDGRRDRCDIGGEAIEP